MNHGEEKKKENKGEKNTRLSCIYSLNTLVGKIFKISL